MTTAQLATLRADINADGTLSQFPNNADGAYAIAAAYNLLASPLFYVWCSNVAVDQIFNAVTWANLTPTDAPDTTQLWMNRALCCQGKQFNIQTMLTGRTTLLTGLATVRAGLQDALTNIPSGASGAILSAGWVALRDGPLKRTATRGEKLFADTAGGNGLALATPAALVVEGQIQPQEIQAARSN